MARTKHVKPGCTTHNCRKCHPEVLQNANPSPPSAAGGIPDSLTGGWECCICFQSYLQSAGCFNMDWHDVCGCTHRRCMKCCSFVFDFECSVKKKEKRDMQSWRVSPAPDEEEEIKVSPRTVTAKQHPREKRSDSVMVLEGDEIVVSPQTRTASNGLSTQTEELELGEANEENVIAVIPKRKRKSEESEGEYEPVKKKRGRPRKITSS